MSHDAAISISEKAHAIKEEGGVRGSWGDPKFKIMAKNFPKSSLEDDQTPMTGIEFGISQKIALTTKYGNIKDAFRSMGEAKEFESKDKVREIIRSFWVTLADQRRLKEELKIFKENLQWFSKILRVSKKRYTNGKISQQALLDIQIRKSEIEADLSNIKFELKESLENLSYILGIEGVLDQETIPWKLAEENDSKKIDLKELAFKSNLKSKEYILKAKKQSFVPDITFSFGYTKRSNIDNQGDFVSGAIAFPLPFSGDKYSGYDGAVHEKTSASRSLRDYQRKRDSEKRRLIHVVSKIKRELTILNTKTIKFAENSREVTSKSYTQGRSSYIELLQSELKLQSLLLKRSKLNSNLAKKQILKKYITGEKLYE